MSRLAMPSMPFFTLPIASQPASGAQGSPPSSALSSQKNTATQALSPTAGVESPTAEEAAGASFSQTLEAQLQVPVLSVGQEFAAIVPTQNALAETLAPQQDPAASDPALAAWAALSPLNNEPVVSAQLDLQGIRQQRALSDKLTPPARSLDGAQSQAGEAALAGAPLPGGAQAQQVAAPLPLGTSPLDASPVSQQILAANPPAVAGITQPGKPLTAVLRESGPVADEWLNNGLHGEQAMPSLHEKPITLTAKASLLPEPFTLPPQALPSEPLPTVGADLSQLGSSTISKDIMAAEPTSQKTPLASAVASAGQFKLDVPPSNPQWSEQIAKRIGIMNSESVQSARIQLDPPELGALEVKIKIQNDQMTVAFSSGNQQVREALEAQSPRLKEMMEAQGLNLSDVNVSDQSRQQTAGGQEQGESAQQGPQSEMAAEGEREQAMGSELQSDSLVDYFA